MLVLTRKQQEKIRIGNDITITVLKTKGKAVRLGIEAPAEVPVVRGELKFDGNEGVVHEAAEAEVAVESASKSEAARRAAPDWPAGSAPTVRQVHFERVPRARMAGALSRLSPGQAPLRAMLERRSLTA